ncbi:MAG TPA: aldehyde ferredoxin oxidoreductase family protein [Dehalococcoidia bacterium]|nr:aldehyde ferredoxin oxidoreductase family protein [Dehalococcoidia bacterium]
MHGFYNKVLHINLTRRSFDQESVNDEVYQKYLGGKGLSTHLLLNNTKAGVDPLSEDNVLIFATGPTTNTTVWGSSRYGVFTKSPLTGLYAESYAGGKVAEPLSGTGYDAIVIHGASENHVYLEISDEGVKFHHASNIWGKDTYETEDIIKREVGVKNAGVVVIGPAGENLVRFACIENDYFRSAGRTGVGAVMGSKKIKGIAFYGNKEKQVAKPDLLRKLYIEIRDIGKEDPGVKRYKDMGTLQMVPVMNKFGAFPTRYWHAGTYDKWQNLTMDALQEKSKVRAHACPKCFAACGRATEVLEGRHKGLKQEIDYETVGSFGGLCLIDDITEVLYLNDICDRLGIDTMTAGNLCGFTIEASHRQDIGEIIEYGDVDGIATLLNKMARKEGIGATLAEGVKHASKEWGLEDFAAHVKGLDFAMYDPRALKGMGLAFATSDRGACHLRATIYKAEISGLIAPDEIEGKAEIFIDFEDRHTLFDALILCRFFRDLYPWEKISTLINATTGLELGKKQLQKMASDITNKAREFNLREGMKRADEMLPKRFFEDKLEDSGKVLPKADFDKMLSDYYRIKGWHAPPNE